MDRDTAVRRIQRGLGFRSDRESEIVDAMQEEQRDLERGKTLPPFLKTSAILTPGAGDISIDLPADFLRLTGDRIQVDPSGTADRRFWRYLEWTSPDALRYPVDAAAESGAPSYAALVTESSTIWFDTFLSTSLQVYLPYYQEADLLTSNIENLWLEHAPELIIGGAGLRIAADMRNNEAIKVFSEIQKRARGAWFSESIIDEVDREGPLVLGGSA